MNTVARGEDLSERISPVEEAILNAEEQLIKAGLSEGIQEHSYSGLPELDRTNCDDDALMMQSFYESHWITKSPPLPIEDWASSFPNLKLSNASVNKYSNLSGEETREIGEKEEKIRDIRSKLKDRLRKDLMAEALRRNRCA